MVDIRFVPTESYITHNLPVTNIQHLKATHRICAYSIIHETNRIKSIRYCCGMNERCIIDASSPALYISVCKSPHTASERESKSTEATFHHFIHLIYSFALAWAGCGDWSSAEMDLLRVSVLPLNKKAAVTTAWKNVPSMFPNVPSMSRYQLNRIFCGKKTQYFKNGFWLFMSGHESISWGEMDRFWGPFLSLYSQGI